MTNFQPATIEERPSCIKCQRQMENHNKGSRCKHCNVSVTRYSMRYFSARDARKAYGKTPACIRCKSTATKRHDKRQGIQRIQCMKCGRTWSMPKKPRKVIRKRTPATPEGLLMFTLSLIPRQLPPEIKEEVQAALTFDLLTKKVSAGALLDPKLVRRYVREAYGLVHSGKFVELDAPVRHNSAQTFGELLEG